MSPTNDDMQERFDKVYEMHEDWDVEAYSMGYVVNETFMYRIQKYWLKGEKAGTSEVFIENLPGFPDNVSSNEEGIFWVALFNPRNDFIEMSSNKPFLRKLVLRLPELF